MQLLTEAMAKRIENRACRRPALTNDHERLLMDLLHEDSLTTAILSSMIVPLRVFRVERHDFPEPNTDP